MESPEHERAAVLDFVRVWAEQADASVEHAEKLQSEPIFGRTHDVWDVHLSGRRLWVITEPMFAYEQSQVRSLDVALSLHVGLVSRMRFGAGAESASPATTNAIEEVDRCQQQMHHALMGAVEVDELQAVGVRAREALLCLSDLMRRAFEDGEAPAGDVPKRADFRSWCALTATRALPGRSLARLRSAVAHAGEDAWNASNWLTHSRNASYADAMLVVNAVDRALDVYRLAMTRHRSGPDRSCAKCGSRRWWPEHRNDGHGGMKLVLVCAYCGTEGPTDTEKAAPPSTGGYAGECVSLDGFAATLTPGRLKRELERVAEGLAQPPGVAPVVGNAGEDDSWGNFFAVELDDKEFLIDVRRLMYLQRAGSIPHGAAITYTCEEARCVNPEHVEIEMVDTSTDGWHPAIIDAIVFRDKSVYLSMSIPSVGTIYGLLTDDVRQELGIYDFSMWLERQVMVATDDGKASLKILPLGGGGDARSLRPTKIAISRGPEMRGDPESFAALGLGGVHGQQV